MSKHEPPAARPTKLELKARKALGELQRRHPSLAPEAVHLVGVSGGRDSVALLHFLVQEGYTRLVVCHLNHALRGKESDADAAFVRELAATHQLAFEETTVPIADRAARTKTSLETAGREARREFFQSVASRRGASHIFVAHHADDDVETILHHLLRGSGLRGVRGMDPVSPLADGISVVRPFLEVTREEINAYLSAHGLTYREDSSNRTTVPTRNRMRHQVLPFLKETLQRDVAGAIQRFARLAGQDDDFMEQAATAFVNEHGLLQPDGSLRTVPALKNAHPALQSRILRWWLREIHAVPNVGAAEVISVLALLDKTSPARCNLPGNGWVRRKAGRLFLESPASPAVEPPKSL